MSTLPGRDQSALIVIDMQRRVVAEAHRRDEVVATIAGLVERARGEGVPVVWVQHSDEELVAGSPGWQYVPELVMAPGEPVVQKHFGDSFEETDLEEVLAERAIGRLVVTGAQSDACIRATLHGAQVRGYDTALVSDAHTTEDLRQWGGPIGPAETIAFTNLYWQNSQAPGRSAEVTTSADVDFRAGG